MEKTKKPKIILKGVNMFMNIPKGFGVVDLTPDLQEFVEENGIPEEKISEDGKSIVFTISKFAKYRCMDEKNDYKPSYYDNSGFYAQLASGVCNAKFGVAEYDWRYAGRKGHTIALQLEGAVFRENPSCDPLSELEFDGQDGDEELDTPF